MNSNSGFKLNSLTLDTNNRTRTVLQADQKGQVVNQSGSIINVSVNSPQSRQTNKLSTINKEGMERKPGHHKDFSIVKKPSEFNSNKKLKKNIGSTVDTDVEELKKNKTKTEVSTLKTKKRSIVSQGPVNRRRNDNNIM